MASGDSKAFVGKDFPHSQTAANDEVNRSVRGPVYAGVQHLRAAPRAAFFRARTAVFRLLLRWRRARRDAQAIAELEALDDRALRDIGITCRAQIAAFVKSASERAASRVPAGEHGLVDIRSRNDREASDACDRAA